VRVHLVPSYANRPDNLHDTRSPCINPSRTYSQMLYPTYVRYGFFWSPLNPLIMWVESSRTTYANWLHQVKHILFYTNWNREPFYTVTTKIDSLMPHFMFKSMNLILPVNSIGILQYFYTQPLVFKR
jgi:hypothetical protein